MFNERLKNIWFTGTGNFAALCLENLINEGIKFSKILTGLPTRSGRNGKENPSAVELKASSLGLNVSCTGKLSDNKELIAALESEQPDVIFVVDFGQIIRPPFLTRMCLNIHPSLLPEYRGAAPIQRSLLDGKDCTGVTVFRLAEAMDAGDILAQARTEIRPDDYASDLYPRLADLGCELAVNALNAQTLTFTPQDDSLATYAPKLDKSDFTLSFNTTARDFVNRVRALDMSGGAYVMIRGKRVKIWRAAICKDFTAQTPGQVLKAKGNPVITCCGRGVELLQVQSEGKKKSSGDEWSRGVRLQYGEIV